MKRIIFLMVVVLSAMSIHAQQYYGRVSDSDGYSNIRRGPGTGYAIVRTYRSGDYLYYTPQKNGWSKVYSGKSSNTFMGYMSTNLIVRVNPQTGATQQTSSLRSGTITDPVDSYVNVRRGPGTNYSISSRLNVGTSIFYQPVNSSWAKVYNRNKAFLGYVALSRIRR